VRHLIFILIFLTSCGPRPEYIYVDISLEHFLNKWWALGDNPLFDENSCFLLDSNDQNLYQLWEGDDTSYKMATWEMHEDHILVLDYSGYDAELRPYGYCDDFTLSATVLSITQETNLYKCEF
tara:strand:- start:772 stop:1140 length:369 start_codon:yes stop_codon:yes gene_type:complete